MTHAPLHAVDSRTDASRTPAAVSVRRHTKPWLRPRTADVRNEIARLDPERDCERIAHLLSLYEFPFDVTRSLEMALFHTFGSRSVARLLDRTRELSKHGQKRYDDTRLLVAELLESGFTTGRGARALRQMNHIHSHFQIPNDDYLFVLWTFIDFPIQWIAEFGYRPLTDHEQRAWFHFWRQVGACMGMRDIPSSKADFDAFVRDYEQREFVPSEAAHRVAEATFGTMASWLPPALRPAVRPLVLGLLRPRLLPAIGFEAPPRWQREAVRSALRLRARAKRFVSLESYPTTIGNTLNRTYPHNRYEIEQLGPAFAHAKTTTGPESDRPSG